ncbi:MAG: chorismate synthase [Selenomonadaceae bacterium]|jgi:chorismate synthase|nr:chorismate synthase [Selenomonadaceae bacterium]
MGNFRFLTAGESHGQCLTAIVEGIPAGLKINLDEMNKDMARRQQGFGRGGRMKIETDRAEFLSGVRFGETMGDPVTIKVANRDWQNWTDRMSVMGEEFGDKVTAVRPGHADLTGVLKYDRNDARDILERASARETATRVAVGGLCKQFLKACGIEVVSHVVKIGGIGVDESKIDYAKIGTGDSELNCYDPEAEEKMKERILSAMQEGDTLGGVFEVIVRGVPLGLGSHIQWDKRLDGKLAWAMMGIQAIKGVEIGAGFQCGELPGSEIHDEMFYDENKKVYRKTNRAGGLEGGMSNGEDIVIRACMKPIPTLMKPLHSIDIGSETEVLACKERSDVCAVSAASVVGEAMAAIVIAEAVTDKFGNDAMVDVLSAMKAYKARVQE